MGKEDKTQKQPMEFYNMSDFLRGTQQYLVDVAKFAYSCAVKGVILESVITKLRIAA